LNVCALELTEETSVTEAKTGTEAKTKRRAFGGDSLISQIVARNRGRQGPRCLELLFIYRFMEKTSVRAVGREVTRIGACLQRLKGQWQPHGPVKDIR
jgi:hypothetical protein